VGPPRDRWTVRPTSISLAAPDRAASLGPFVASRRGAENSPWPLVRLEAWFREHAGMVETRVMDSRRVAEARDLEAAVRSGGGSVNC
jgi:hypothetical protein